MNEDGRLATDVENEGKHRKRATKKDSRTIPRLRRIAASGILVAGIAIAALGLIRECTTLNDDGVTSVTCEPPSASSPIFILWITCVALLLLPDVDHLEFGGIAIKRRVEEVREESQLLRREVAALSSVVSVTATSSATAQTNNYLLNDSGMTEVLGRLASLLEDDGRNSDAGADQTGNPAPSVGGEAGEVPSDDADLSPGGPDAREHGPAPRGMESQSVEDSEAQRNALSVELLRNWEIIQEAVPIRLRSRRRESSPWQQNFYNEMREPIDLIRRARNNVAHSQQISFEDLEAAVKMSRMIISLIRDSVESIK